MAGDESLAWGFPGQGVPWEAVVERLAAGAGDDLATTLSRYTGTSDWSAVDPADTARAQPAILVASLLAAAERDPDEVSVICGHSFGELAALVAGGVIAADDAVGLARLRGELGAQVRDETGGAMLAAVSVDEWEVERLRRRALAEVGGHCEVAVRNHRVQVVLAGSRPTLEWIGERIPPLGGRAHLLPIGGPYHTPWMAEAAPRYREAVEGLDRRPPRWPVLLSTAPYPVAGPDDVALLPERLADSLVLPVDWPRTLALARDRGATRGLDLGPGNVLARIGRRAGLAFDALWEPPATVG